MAVSPARARKTEPQTGIFFVCSILFEDTMAFVKMWHTKPMELTEFNFFL